MSHPVPGAVMLVLAATCSLASARAHSQSAQDARNWPQHSLTRPRPAVIDPAPASSATRPPSDAIVLFDGRDLSRWEKADDEKPGAAAWKVAHGYMEVVGGAGNIRTKQRFGDIQLHIEWSAPAPPHGESQERGNSGVFLMGMYEVQILDSYQNETYADGQAASVFGQYPPLVNASRPPGQWQSFDIVWHRPQFDNAGALVRPAFVTVLHNGVLVQDNVELLGPTAHQRRPPYAAHADRLPFSLQDHGFPVRFRNVWVRPLE
ncbi:MAG: DUF1080 domain-containing protein [Gemmatimonadota bacterium]|nr:DUF1080 domain-containing protein [Gemmatimonadota bacterium]